MKEIPLTKGCVALVDDEDYEYLSKFSWHTQDSKKQSSYASRGVWNPETKKVTNVLMHRVIMDIKDKAIVDHINHNTLDNRKSNLRICDYVKNGGNRFISKNNKCGYKGVRWHDLSCKWQAYIGKKTIGYFKTKEDAANAYNNKAIEKYGEFACLNHL